jgi:hypothetical protein
MPLPLSALRTARLVRPHYFTEYTVLVNTGTKLRPGGEAVNAQMFRFQNYSADEGSVYRHNLIVVPVSGLSFNPSLKGIQNASYRLYQKDFSTQETFLQNVTCSL